MEVFQEEIINVLEEKNSGWRETAELRVTKLGYPKN